MFKCHGEEGEADHGDHATAAVRLPELHHIVAQYNAHDVFNADESGL